MHGGILFPPQFLVMEQGTPARLLGILAAAFAPGLAGNGAAMRQAICRQQSESTIRP